jgi:hypothetical protein
MTLTTRLRPAILVALRPMPCMLHARHRSLRRITRSAHAACFCCHDDQRCRRLRHACRHTRYRTVDRSAPGRFLEKILQLCTRPAAVLPAAVAAEHAWRHRWRSLKPLPDGARLPAAQFSRAAVRGNRLQGDRAARSQSDHHVPDRHGRRHARRPRVVRGHARDPSRDSGRRHLARHDHSGRLMDWRRCQPGRHARGL